jgi:hypothetical protein
MFLALESVQRMTVRQACDEITRAPRKSVSNLRLLDLLFDPEGTVPGQNGVYIFFSETGECLYVGKNSSQTFVERIPWHFAIGEGSYANHLLKKLRKVYQIQSLEECAKKASSFELLLIPIPVWENIKPLETLLRRAMHPKLNKCEGWNEEDVNRPVGDFLK